jgi:hypothetical protein
MCGVTQLRRGLGLEVPAWEINKFLDDLDVNHHPITGNAIQLPKTPPSLSHSKMFYAALCAVQLPWQLL